MAGKFSLADHLSKAQPPQVRDIEAITVEILDAKRTGGEAILTIGRGLMEAKALLSHGEWLPWLEERVEFSEKAAQRFMLLARKYSNPTTLSDLGASKALLLLALPDGEREDFIEVPHVVDGEEKAVSDMSVRELKAVIKERDDALKAMEQAKAGQSAAEQAREKLSQDMALANERIAGLNAEVEKWSAEASEAQETAARLEQELEALRAQPRDVAVEVDEAAVEAARKEVEAAMQDELDRAKAARDKALEKRYKLEESLARAKAEVEKARKAAEDAKAEAQMEVEQVNAKLESARLQAEEARKKAAVTTDPDLVLFSELLDQGQTIVNRMGGIRQKKKDKDPETAERLQDAMVAYSSRVKEVAMQ